MNTPAPQSIYTPATISMIYASHKVSRNEDDSNEQRHSRALHRVVHEFAAKRKKETTFDQALDELLRATGY